MHNADFEASVLRVFHKTVRHLHDTGRDDPAYDLRQQVSPSDT